MAYNIEDIDWNQMPKGAVEFVLKDDDYIACWYNEDGEYSDMDNHNGWYTPIIDPEDPEDIRVRYKVSDYHPSTTTNRKPTREERLDRALRTLMQSHFFGSGFEWSWRDGKTLEDADKDLYTEIVDLLR